MRSEVQVGPELAITSIIPGKEDIAEQREKNRNSLVEEGIFQSEFRIEILVRSSSFPRIFFSKRGQVKIWIEDGSKF